MTCKNTGFGLPCFSTENTKHLHPKQAKAKFHSKFHKYPCMPIYSLNCKQTSTRARVMASFENHIFSSRKHKLSFASINEIQETEGEVPTFRKWLWWEPGDSWIQDFLGYSSIHGLKYISKRKLSIFERGFWIFAFVASLCGALFMIGQVWNRYHKSPVIVTFNPSETETYHLAFPAVTICNKSLFSKKKVVKLLEEVRRTNRTADKEKVRLLNSLCTLRQSFLQKMKFMRPEAFPEWEEINKPPSQETVNGVIKFIYDHSQICAELLRGCSWEGRRRKCSDLFHPIVTDYGKCCVFNKMPSELMDFEVDDDDLGQDKREIGWSYEDIKEWDKWDYANNGFMIKEPLKYPLRQKRAGSTYGLSVLVDPDTENSFCQSQDSLGVKLLLHTPADVPRVTHMGTGFGLQREIFLKVFPDSTIADKNILDYDYEQRKCIFGKTAALGNGFPIDRPYTRNNCFLTCNQRHVLQMCNCTLHSAKRRRGVSICNPYPGSKDDECVKSVERDETGTLKQDCSRCVYACNYLKYMTESTEANLLDPAELWGDNETNKAPEWSDHRLSIIHIFMGAEMHVPKVRQKLYHYVDLIASIGGLLSLSLGVSILAAIEIMYLLTIRICCKRFRKWHVDEIPKQPVSK